MIDGDKDRKIKLSSGHFGQLEKYFSERGHQHLLHV
jgi:hypothetical protein